MSRTLQPDNAAQSIIAHHATLQREKAYIAGVYREYDGLRSLDTALEAAGILAEVQAIAAGSEGGK